MPSETPVLLTRPTVLIALTAKKYVVPGCRFNPVTTIEFCVVESKDFTSVPPGDVPIAYWNSRIPDSGSWETHDAASSVLFAVRAPSSVTTGVGGGVASGANSVYAPLLKWYVLNCDEETIG